MAQKQSQKTKKPRSGFWILLVAAIVLEAISCIQYFYSRSIIESEAENHAKSELKAAELEINVVTTEMEAAVKMLSTIAERYLDKPEAMYLCTRFLLETLDNVESAGIAFVPNYFPKQGRWFEVCSSRYTEETFEGDGKGFEMVGNGIYTRQIGGADHDYLSSEWFGNGMTIDSCWWCEPYLDDAGAQKMVVSCSYPIHDHEGKVVAVALVDLSLQRLTNISQYLQVFKDSYFSIQSSTGVDIVERPDTASGRKYKIYDEEIDATGWHISIIIPEDVLYAQLKHVGMIVTLLMLLGMLLLVFILYRAGRDIRNLMSMNRQKERISRELEIAKNIQTAMLPKTFPPYHNRQDLSMYGLILPAKEVGGDLYDFFERDEKLFFCVGDVSGKGVPASLVMAMTRSLFRSFSVHEHDVAALTMQINNAMSETNEQNMFVTLFIGIMDLQTGQLSYCNAGHNAPVLIQHSWQTDCPSGSSVEMLPTIPNLPLGILSGYAYTPQTTTIQRGDTLFLYTDGLTEAENSNKELFGEARMLDALRTFEAAQNNPMDPQKAQQEIEYVLQSVHDFVGEAEQSDDLTMLVIKRLTIDGEQKEDNHPLKHSIVMRNDIQQIPTLAEWIESLNIPVALNMTINLALEEAVTNVMLYAYPNENGKVLIEAEKSERMITFIISDNGIPFDPTQRPEADITLTAEERSIGGLGIHLVRQIMDEIHYERKDNRNILTLVKKL